MKYKLFALLLTVPLVIFGTDRLLASGEDDGGGKEKKAPVRVTTPTPVTEHQQAEAPTPVTDEDVIRDEEQPIQTSTTATTEVTTEAEAKMVAELKATIEESEYSSNLNTWLNEEDHGEEVVAFLEKHVLGPVKKANPMNISLERSYSRCPSGYHLTIIAEDGKFVNEGFIIGDEGCWDRQLGRFRFDVESKEIAVKIGEETGYVSLPLFLKICEKALA